MSYEINDRIIKTIEIDVLQLEKVISEIANGFPYELLHRFDELESKIVDMAVVVCYKDQ